MTNVFGLGAPLASSITEAGPLQLGHAYTVGVPCIVTHIRYYIADVAMNVATPTLPFRVWRQGEPDSTVTGTLTVPAAVGWVTEELSPHLFVPADRRFGASVSFPAGTITYGYEYQALPASNKLLACTGSDFDYSATVLSPYTQLEGWRLDTSYMVDVEVAVSEMVHLAPADMTAGDVLQIRRTTNGTVNTVTPTTDAYTVNLTVDGGPLDGTAVDVWVPDTENGLAQADMTLLKEVADPGVGTRWQASDTSLWVYQGGAVYDCFAPGTTYPEGAKTTRADTPSLNPWSP